MSFERSVKGGSIRLELSTRFGLTRRFLRREGFGGRLGKQRRCVSSCDEGKEGGDGGGGMGCFVRGEHEINRKAGLTSNHGSNVPSRVRLLSLSRELDGLEVFLGRLVKVHRVSFVERVDGSSRRNSDLLEAKRGSK